MVDARSLGRIRQGVKESIKIYETTQGSNTHSAESIIKTGWFQMCDTYPLRVSCWWILIVQHCFKQIGYKNTFPVHYPFRLK